MSHPEQTMPVFAIGDYVYSTIHQKEGMVDVIKNQEVHVMWNKHEGHVFGYGNPGTSVSFLSKINIPASRIEGHACYRKPKIFDWKGKNIQWVRKKALSTDMSYPIAWIGPNGIGIHAYTENTRYPTTCAVSWEDLKNEWAWSEDNNDWRNFE